MCLVIRRRSFHEIVPSVKVESVAFSVRWYQLLPLPPHPILPSRHTLPRRLVLPLHMPALRGVVLLGRKGLVRCVHGELGGPAAALWGRVGDVGERDGEAGGGGVWGGWAGVEEGGGVGVVKGGREGGGRREGWRRRGVG